MQVWMLSKFYTDTVHGFLWPYADAYANGHVCPVHPDPADGWALVKCESNTGQLEAAAQDPNVQPYRTMWDTITAETASAYQNKGATAGMMLCQLIALLAQSDGGFAG